MIYLIYGAINDTYGIKYIVYGINTLNIWYNKHNIWYTYLIYCNNFRCILDVNIDLYSRLNCHMVVLFNVPYPDT